MQEHAGPPGAGTAEVQGRAMGSHAQILVSAQTSSVAQQLAQLGMRRVELLEQCWTRFRSDSELMQLNAQAGTGAVPVSADLGLLVRRMQDAWSWTQGAFDPTVLRSMVSLGYDVDFNLITTGGPGALPRDLRAAPGMADVVVDESTVSLPAHLALDPGGIGKGLAADIISAELMAAGATGVLVNLGGDAAARGTCDGEPWTIGIRDDRLTESPVVAERILDPSGQGVATSSILRRRWQGRHHLINPHTGAPSATDVVQATVFAPSAWQAEAMATMALVRGQRTYEEWSQGTNSAAYLFGTATEPTTIIQRREYANA